MKFKPGMACLETKNGLNPKQFNPSRPQKNNSKQPGPDGIIAKTKPKTSSCCAENVACDYCIPPKNILQMNFDFFYHERTRKVMPLSSVVRGVSWEWDYGTMGL
ncbi:MAG: hypothetical protein PHY82_09695 [Lentisphaeria bacterium]|nr:hypothetical protein [Lentisphaeria bacterium]